MLKLLIVVTVVVLDITLMLRVVRHINEGHALAGRFGDDERERVIARRARVTVLAAETMLHVMAFAEEAQGSTHVSIRRLGGGCHQWDFAGGRRWEVRHQRMVMRGLAGSVVNTTPQSGSVVIEVTSERQRRIEFLVRSAVDVSSPADCSST